MFLCFLGRIGLRAQAVVTRISESSHGRDVHAAGIGWKRLLSGGWPAAIAGRCLHDLSVRTGVMNHCECTGRVRVRPCADSVRGVAPEARPKLGKMSHVPNLYMVEKNKNLSVSGIQTG